ncbi:MAG: protein kinase [Acidimicrobiales bacterium]|nr:protein kinase [Acidimicrobiales bacterium]
MRLRGRKRSKVLGLEAPLIPGCRDLVQVAAGGQAIVYRARQPALDRDVAVKVLVEPLADDRSRRRFERELAVTGRLGVHPNIVAVHEIGFVDGIRPYVVMAWYAGGSVADQLRERGPFDVPTTLGIAVKVCDALAWAHQSGVLHRDVKPQNILLSSLGEPALADFGTAVAISEKTAATSALTPVHAAPEVLEGGTPGPASDVWSLGSAIYTMLVGRAPFSGPPSEGLLSLLLRVVSQPLPALSRADVPASLSGALDKAMAKRPEERWASAVELGSALRAAQAELGLAAPTEAAGPSVPDVIAVPPSPGSEADEEVTRIGRPRGTAAPEAPARPRWSGTRLLISVVAAVFVIGAAAGILAVVLGGGGRHTTAPPPVPRLHVPPPSQVRVVEYTGSSVTLAWHDPNHGQVDYVVEVSPSRVVKADFPNRTTVTGLNPASSYCFRVAAVVSVTAELERSQPVCVGGGTQAP